MRKHIISPNFSVDCVIFGFDFQKLNVLLVERTLEDEKTGKTVFTDYTLAGNHVYDDEDFDSAAERILYDLTGFEHIYLEQFHTFGNPDRLNKEKDVKWLQHLGMNPENRIITVAYYSLVNINEKVIKEKGRKIIWHAIDEPIDLAFDHGEIIEKALEALRNKIRTNPIGFKLLPPKFTLTQLQKLYEEIMGVTYDKRNFRKKISRMDYLVPLNEKQKGVAHKPARLFTFSKDVYETTKKDFFDFTV